MPLNVSAKEFRPTALISQELMSMRLGGGRNPAAGRAPPEDESQPASPATSSGDPPREDELQFEEMFDRCASAEGSNHTTPRTSLVGPSPMPTPAASPQTGTKGSLLAVTERTSPPQSGKDPQGRPPMSPTAARLNGAVHASAVAAALPKGAAAAIAAAIPMPDSEPVPTVVTHVETPASAAVTAANGAPKKLGPNDFELLRVVGQGAFGKVFQVRKRDTGEVFAMKVMRKDRILEKSHGEYVRAERDALTAVVHPYVVTLRYSFQTSRKLYLVLDFINGGHLFFQLYRAGTFDEPLARLYTAELVLALAHLHSLGFVHRDLKPENVLLDNEGHVRVTDFGLAKGNMSDAEHHRTNSYIGTMEYMAPEIIAGRGHGKAVDWWSVGVLLYEMLCGMPPFRAKSKPALEKLITTAKPKLPKYLGTEACSLLRNLLQKDASKRLGFGPTGSKDVMSHPFFKGIDWKLLESRDVPSPFKPKITSRDSVENFDKIWTDLPPQDSPCATPTQSRSLESDSVFEGFTYCAPSFLAQAGALLATPTERGLGAIVE